MRQSKIFESHLSDYLKWFEVHQFVFQSELLAIKKHFEQMPQNIQGIEVGLGTGMFAEPLGIKEGVEPVDSMREIARKKGIEVMNATAENLPYKDLHFDFVLFVTIAHLTNISRALKEARRVLKTKGTAIIAFIEKNGTIGRSYEEKRSESTFYRNARFYTVEEIHKLLKDLKFKNIVTTQTLFDSLENIKAIEEPRDGFGDGSFVIVRATKS